MRCVWHSLDSWQQTVPARASSANGTHTCTSAVTFGVHTFIDVACVMMMQSDPGVFSELLEAFGVSGVQVEELWAMDEDAYEPLRPIYGLFFLFKWKKDAGSRAARC